MTTIDIDEATRNAILAALDERAARLERAIQRGQLIWDTLIRAGQPVADDTQRVIVWSVAALHETNMARLQVAEAGEPVPTLAEAVPWEPAVKPVPWEEVAEPFHDWQAR